MVVASRSTAALEEVVRRIQALGRRSLAVELDLSHLRGIDPLVKRTMEAFDRINILVNNAGTNVRKPPVESTGERLSTLLPS